jgi:magnesium-transporting ATPase (P-type)
MMAFSFLTTTLNYFLLYGSYKKIKLIAEKTFKVNVLRNGRLTEIDNVEIVPGDIYEPSEEVPCDSLIVSGELFANEVSLTG